MGSSSVLPILATQFEIIAFFANIAHPLDNIDGPHLYVRAMLRVQMF